ncbi:hypothetical protein J2X68_006819 [Streptomyces sp. 3330]|uniref:hypothetical protein n=1 Tax=Streptomyces sp. 3330 TaxID=2817755 RepID=UPI00285F9771|nr:hypothetical protein [Streptomyces sp. 3330]MDR6980081.1 hypothetical protein [Streptomyces sp. 3330]
MAKRMDDRFPGGHGNNGIAHGVGSILALLALGARRAVTVAGHHEAMRTVLAWLADGAAGIALAAAVRSRHRGGPAERVGLRQGAVHAAAPDMDEDPDGVVLVADVEELTSGTLPDCGEDNPYN